MKENRELYCDCNLTKIILMVCQNDNFLAVWRTYNYLPFFRATENQMSYSDVGNKI